MPHASCRFGGLTAPAATAIRRPGGDVSSRHGPPGRDPGLYQLVIWLPESRRVKVGCLGTFTFPRGYYVYTGSAKRNMKARIARHLRKKGKRMRWHIDYLLRHGGVIGVRLYHGPRSECELSRTVEQILCGKVVVRRFGSSDCECRTHLFYFPPNRCKKLASVALNSKRAEGGRHSRISDARQNPRRDLRRTPMLCVCRLSGSAGRI